MLSTREKGDKAIDRTSGLVISLLLLSARIAIPGHAESPLYTNIISAPLSKVDAINLGLRQNPNILKAEKDLAASQGIAIQTRAIAIPKVRVAGSYSAIQPSDVDKPSNVPGFSFGTDQSWGSQIRLVQSLYEGGRIVSSVRTARLIKEQAVLNYQTVVADAVLEIQIIYDNVLLAEQQIKVQEASVELRTRELADTSRRFEAGTVPRFNVLRSEVELANARPALIRTRNRFRIAKNNLANLLGFNIPVGTIEDIPLQLTGRLQAEPYEIELPRSIELALQRRTELGSLKKALALRKEDITHARAGYKPSLQAFAGYDAHSSLFTPDLTREVHGWITGVQLSWELFDGGLTMGRMKETTALYERTAVELEDMGRRIELEVRTAYSNFIESRELLESQKKVVEQAEEAVRLARARNETGTGTQLDELSAQTSLTEALTTQNLALHDYSVTKARLERATGAGLPGQ
jgi:outer membrane protein TolC